MKCSNLSGQEHFRAGEPIKGVSILMISSLQYVLLEPVPATVSVSLALPGLSEPGSVGVRGGPKPKDSDPDLDINLFSQRWGGLGAGV